MQQGRQQAHRSGCFSGLCCPLLGTALSDSIKGDISWGCMSGSCMCEWGGMQCGLSANFIGDGRGTLLWQAAAARVVPAGRGCLAWMKGSPFIGSGRSMVFSDCVHCPFTARRGMHVDVHELALKQAAGAVHAVACAAAAHPGC